MTNILVIRPPITSWTICIVRDSYEVIDRRKTIEAISNRNKLELDIADLGVESNSSTTNEGNRYLELLNSIDETEKLQNIRRIIIETIFNLIHKFVIFKLFEDMLPLKVTYIQLLSDEEEEINNTKILQIIIIIIIGSSSND